MTKVKQQKFLKNLAKFSLVTFGAFLLQLQAGVEVKDALIVAGLALYQAGMDYYSKK